MENEIASFRSNAKQARIRMLLRFGWLVPTGGGGGLIFWLVSTNVDRGWLAAISAAVVGVLALVAWLIYAADIAESAESRIRQAVEANDQKHLVREREHGLLSDLELRKRESEREVRDQATQLMEKTIEYSSKSLRRITEEFRRLARLNARLDLEGFKKEWAGTKELLLEEILANINTAFESDHRGVDRTVLPSNFFKTALFEPRPSPETAITLHRTAYRYPDFVEPSPKTDVWNLNDDEERRSAVARAFLSQGVEVLEDIKQEREKPAEIRRWMDKPEGQADRYESMVCVAIVSGKRKSPSRRCLAVLVVDTNRKGYFSEDINSFNFLGRLFNPFRTILTLVLEAETYLQPSASPIKQQRSMPR